MCDEKFSKNANESEHDFHEINVNVELAVSFIVCNI